MAATSTHNERITPGNIVKGILSSDNGKSTQIVFKINSENTQIGDENQIIGLDVIPRSRTETEGIPMREILELNSETATGPIFIQARFVQIVNIGDNELEIIVESGKGSSVQIGGQCKLDARDEQGNDARKTEVNTKDQKKQKKQRLKTHKRTSATNTNKEARKTAPIDSPKCLEICDQFFREIQKVLHPLRDNGKWSAFDKIWNELMGKYGKDPTWNILLQLEYGMRVCYHSQFKLPHLDEAEKILHQGREEIKMLEGIDQSIKRFCEGRLHCYLASVYRRKKVYGRAEKCLEIAEHIFQNTGNESFLYDKATFYYEKGSRFHDFDQKGVDNESAKHCFEKCYELCIQLSQKGWDFVKKGKFAQLKKVMLLLAGSTKKGRKRHISGEDLEEAKKCLDDLDKENDKKHECPISEQLQHLLAKSDYYFRMRDSRQAIEFLRRTIVLADEHGFDSMPAKRRLLDIQERVDAREESQTQRNDYKKKKHSQDKEETTALIMSCDADGSASQSTGNSDVGL